MLAFLLPPLIVALRTSSTKKTIIAIVLMLLGHIPAIIYALYQVSRVHREAEGRI